MKRCLLLLAVMIGSALFHPSGAQMTASRMFVQPKNTWRIMSYNVRNARGMDDVVDYDRIAAAISAARPDIVALQELDNVTRRSGGVNVIEELALRCGMFEVYVPAIRIDGGSYGVGLLSNEKPVSHYPVALPGSDEKRVLLVVEFPRFVVGCTHLSLNEADRLASVAILKAEADKLKKPFIIAGDLNAEPESAEITSLAEGFNILSDPKQLTYPAAEPTECIDYIAVDNDNAARFTLFSTNVMNQPAASDHLPVVVELRMAAEKEDIFYNKPYLQNPVGGITVMWQTTVPTYSWVEYGTDTLNLTRARTLVDGQVICNDIHNKIRIENLTPGQKYYYRVCSQEITRYQAYSKMFGETAVSPFYSFTLPAPDQTDFTAIVFNDLHKQEPVLRALYEQVKDIPYDFVVFNGDCIDDPVDEAQTLFHLKMQCERVGASNVPAFYLRGNHEIRNAFSIGLRGLLDYVGDKTYGAFSWGDTRIVMLDCGEDKPDDHPVYYDLNDFSQLRLDQKAFLQKELASKEFTQAKARVLFNHIPLYGRRGPSGPSAELWADELSTAPFNVNISAHTHRIAYTPKGTAGNNFPVMVGGGSNIGGASVMVLQKRGAEMSLRVLNAQGTVLHDIKL